MLFLAVFPMAFVATESKVAPITPAKVHERTFTPFKKPKGDHLIEMAKQANQYLANSFKTTWFNIIII